MNVDEFYAEDERRRASDEVSFGGEWRVASDPYVLYGIHWIEDTGEVYALRGPQPPVLDFSGEVGGSPVSLAALRVRVGRRLSAGGAVPPACTWLRGGNRQKRW